MNRSDWIALLAAIGTLLGLIPAYHQFIQGRKSKKKKKAVNLTSSPEAEKISADPPSEIGAFEKALGCTVIGVLVLVVELILFSWIARMFGVNFESASMPLNWKVGFILLFILPIFMFYLAFLHIAIKMSG